MNPLVMCKLKLQVMDLSSKKRHELVEIAKDLGIDDLFGMRSQEIIDEIKKRRRLGESTEGGFIYVLVSSEKPNLVKIGITERDPEKRAQELTSSTGVAMPYIVISWRIKPPQIIQRRSRMLFTRDLRRSG